MAEKIALETKESATPERSDKRQIASSLRSLFRNREWLNEHTE
jgi:hypothetical protein